MITTLGKQQRKGDFQTTLVITHRNLNEAAIHRLQKQLYEYAIKLDYIALGPLRYA